MEDEVKDLVWLPKSLCQLISNVQDEAVVRESIMKYVEETKAYLKDDIKIFEDEILSYRASMDKIKIALREAKEEQLNALYTLWDKFENDINKIKDFVKTAKDELNPLQQELENLKKLMDSIDNWGIKNFLELIKSINSNYYGETKTIIDFLLLNYKKKD